MENQTKTRTFTPEYKAEVVLAALSDESSQAEVCRRHSAMNNFQSGSDSFLKMRQLLFEHADKA